MELLETTPALHKLTLGAKLQILRFLEAGNGKECTANKLQIAVSNETQILGSCCSLENIACGIPSQRNLTLGD